MKTFIILLTILTSSISYAQLYRASDHLGQIYFPEVAGHPAYKVVNQSLYEYEQFLRLEVNSPRLNPHHSRDLNKPRYLSLENAQKVLAAANANPVVATYQYQKYDPENKGIGFCFGRAMFTHLYLAISGFDRGSIKKAFVVGPMEAGGSFWAWHVTTIVQSRDHKGREIWLTIDPIFGEVLEVREWYKQMQEMSQDGKLRLYITEAGKFQIGSSRYDEGHIKDSFYNDYFKDMMKWFEKNDVSKELNL
jgi:hypothetical protein